MLAPQTTKRKVAPPWSHHEIEQVRFLILQGKSLHPSHDALEERHKL